MALDYTFHHTTYPFLANTIGGAVLLGIMAGVAGVAIDYELGDEFRPTRSFIEWSMWGATGGACMGFGRVTRIYYS